jgi:hypothetical protein
MDKITASDFLAKSEDMRTSGVKGEAADKIGNCWHRECLKYVRIAAGAQGGVGSAFAAWQLVPEHQQHPTGLAPVFWRSPVVPNQPEGDGHVVVSRGDGTCNTTDFVRKGFIDIADIADIGVKKWKGLTYLGWGERINNVEVLEIETVSAHLPKGTKVSLTNVRNAFTGMLSDPDVVAVKAALHAEGLLPRFWKGPKVGKTTRRAYAQWQILFSTKGRQEAAGIPTATDLRALGDKQGFKVEA